MSELIQQNTVEHLTKDACSIIESAQRVAYQSVNVTLVLRNWLLGRLIAEDNMDGSRADRYGVGIIEALAEKLTDIYGRGFDKRTLYRYVKFYQLYHQIVGTLSPQSLTSLPMLSWSHYERLLQVSDPNAREWYEKEAIAQSWSVRTLRRNIDG